MSWNCIWNPTESGSAFRIETDEASSPELRSHTLNPLDVETVTKELLITLPPLDSLAEYLPIIEPPFSPAWITVAPFSPTAIRYEPSERIL